jgi:CheY-like chemotaxis protein
VKFTPRGGRVDVILKREGSYAAIVVSDSGIGVKREFLPHIFERFRQVDSSTTRRSGGLGLGLAIVRHLVELHGGSVWADSPGENQGATFTVHLPLAVAGNIAAGGRNADDGDRHDGKDQLAGVKVLLVEDDEDSRELMSRMLRQRGADVTSTSNAADAMSVFLSDRPDVLVSDIGMPDIDGYELLRRVRALGARRGGKVPAIALTALARPDDRRRALHVGYQVHVPKPADASELAAVVANLAPTK